MLRRAMGGAGAQVGVCLFQGSKFTRHENKSPLTLFT